MRLGPRQLELLRKVGTTRLLVAPDARSRRLCELGLMRAHGEDGGMVGITPAGLRALADAAEEGRIEIFRMREREETTDAP